MIMVLQDALGRNLGDGFYCGHSGQIYKIKVRGDTFSAENARGGFMAVTNYRTASRELTKLVDPEADARFILDEIGNDDPF